VCDTLESSTSARLYKTFKGKEWQKCTTYTAFLFPGGCFVLFLFFNVVLSSYHSTGAIPFLSLAALIALWFGISVPLVFLGAYFGYKQSPIEYPTKQANVIPRAIPEQVSKGVFLSVCVLQSHVHFLQVKCRFISESIPL
jgi:transmembrane 9 superfamily protein 2/4